MLHLSELHGAATHLAVLAVPLYALVLILSRLLPGNEVVAGIEPWALAAVVVGMAAAGITGLLVWGQAQTMLRGQDFRIGTAHFWLGIGLAVLLLGLVALRFVHARPVLVVAGLMAVAAVVVQGYLGGRMTYAHGVGVDSGGQAAQTAAGVKRLEAQLARGRSEVSAGKQAYSADGLGCARCHGRFPYGGRGPALSGGLELKDFREVHEHGLFPRSAVSDRDVRAIDAWLRTLPKRPLPID